jgi:Raf kinase inhibitor-like YbhB/YbcL family protein
MEDPDTPGEASTHWMLYNMLPATLEIRENLPPPTGKTGTNDFGHAGYDGPCPPSGTHRYVWRLYALTSMLNIPEGVSRRGLQEAMEGYITDTAELVGWYTKSAETSR